MSQWVWKVDTFYGGAKKFLEEVTFRGHLKCSVGVLVYRVALRFL
jgi:hypothetical protein